MSGYLKHSYIEYSEPVTEKAGMLNIEIRKILDKCAFDYISIRVHEGVSPPGSAIEYRVSVEKNDGGQYMRVELTFSDSINDDLMYSPEEIICVYIKRQFEDGE